jgi:methionyl-tRNA formyltransferase
VVGISINGQFRSIVILAKHSFYVSDIENEVKDLNINVIWADTLTEVEELSQKGLDIDLVFFPHFSKKIPSRFLEKYTCVGFHTGDLPSDRGGSPIQNKILRGEYQTVVSAIKLVDDIDAGAVIRSNPVNLEHGSIEDILKDVSKIISKLVRWILTNKIEPVQQVGIPGFSPRLGKSHSEFQIEALEIREIYDRIRMLDGLDYPPAYIAIGQYRIYLTGAEFRDGKLCFNSRLEENEK